MKVEAPTHVALKLLLDSAEDGTMGLRPGHPNIAGLITDSVLSIKTFVQQILVFKIFQWLQAVGIDVTIMLVNLMLLPVILYLFSSKQHLTLVLS